MRIINVPIESLEEIWVPVINFSNYQVSNFGRVRRVRDQRLLKSCKNYKSKLNAYLVVNLYRGNNTYSQQTVHSLVAGAFLGQRPEKAVVNHKDGNKENNRIENLEYVTHKENIQHSRFIGIFSDRKISSESAISIINSKIHPKILAEQYSCSIANIRHIQKGKCFKWIEKSL